MCEAEVKLTLNTDTRTDLELPLGRKNFGVDSGDLDSRKQTGLVVSLNNVTTVNLAGSDTAIVWSLRARETSLWPPVRVSIKVEESVLLLQSKPRLLVLMGLHNLRTLMTM